MLDVIKSPNVFGELLRDIVFANPTSDPHVFGCYTTFAVESEFKPLPKNDVMHAMFVAAYEADLGNLDLDTKLSVRDLFHPEELEYTTELVNSATSVTNGTITASWHWEGDGGLMVSDGKRLAFNGDCKKDHIWSWVPHPSTMDQKILQCIQSLVKEP